MYTYIHKNLKIPQNFSKSKIKLAKLIPHVIFLKNYRTCNYISSDSSN